MVSKYQPEVNLAHSFDNMLYGTLVLLLGCCYLDDKMQRPNVCEIDVIQKSLQSAHLTPGLLCRCRYLGAEAFLPPFGD